MKFRVLLTVLVTSAVVIVTTMLGLVARAQAPNDARYVVTDLGTLGGTYSYGYGINNAGIVSGGAATSSQTNFVAQTAFLWYGGPKLISLGTLGGPDCTGCSSEGGGPNAFGVSVLVSETADFDPNGEDFCAFGTHRQCLGAIWENGVLTALSPFEGGHNSQAYWINNLGQSVGFAEDGTFDSTCASITPFQVLRIEAAIWEPNGKIRQRPPLSGDTISFALGINENGEAVGGSGLCSNTSVPPISPPPASSVAHAVLWDKNGSPVDLGTLGGSTFNVSASINDRGEVVGDSLSSKDGTLHPFLWTKETGIQDLGAPAGASLTGIPCCHTINNKGQVVGFSVGAAGPHAFLWEHGEMTDLNTVIPADSGWVLQFADSINDAGQIVGFGVNGNGETHAFVATPVELRRFSSR
jgi:probable HAF family extracellular repeat protein